MHDKQIYFPWLARALTNTTLSFIKIERWLVKHKYTVWLVFSLGMLFFLLGRVPMAHASGNNPEEGYAHVCEILGYPVVPCEMEFDGGFYLAKITLIADDWVDEPNTSPYFQDVHVSSVQVETNEYIGAQQFQRLDTAVGWNWPIYMATPPCIFPACIELREQYPSSYNGPTETQLTNIDNVLSKMLFQYPEQTMTLHLNQAYGRNGLPVLVFLSKASAKVQNHTEDDSATIFTVWGVFRFAKFY